MASKELQVALRLLAKTNEFQAEIARASGTVTALGTNSAAASDKAKRGLDSAETSAGGLNGALERATKSALAFGAGFIALQTGRQLLAIADSAANMSAKLTLATSSQKELAAATKVTFDIAQATSTGLDATVTLYSRLSSSLKDVGTSQADIAGLTQTINQALTVSGATAEEASSAILQLSQAFASGKLGGEEFGAVNESGGRIMLALAKALDVPRGKLKALSEQGLLTTQVIAAALKEQSSAIADEASKVPITFGRAVTQFTNATIKYIGNLDASTGASKALAGIVLELSNRLPQLATGILGIASAMAVLKFGATAANASILSLGGAVSVLGVGIAAFSLGSILAEEFESVRTAGALLIVSLAKVWEALKLGWQTAFAAIRVAWYVVVDQITERMADLLQSFREAAQIELPFGLRADFTYGAADAMAALEQKLRGATDAASEADLSFGDLDAQYRDSQNSILELTDGLLDGVQAHFDAKNAADAQTGAQGGLSDAAEKTAKELLAEAAANAKGTNAKTGAAAATRALAKAESERSQAVIAASNLQFKAVNEALQANEDLLRIAQSLADEVGGPSAKANQEYARTLAEIDAAYQVILKNAPATQAQINADTQARIDAKTRLDKILTDNDPILQATQAAADNWARYWGDAMGDVIDSFSDFLANGAGSFKDFGKELKRIAKSIVADLISTFLKSKITVPIQAAISSGGGLGGAFSALFNGGAPGGTAASGAPSGALAGLGNIFSTITGFGGGSPIGAGGGILGALPSLFGGLATGIAGLTGGFGALTGAMTIAGTAGIGAATSFGLSSLAAGSFASGIGALIPVIGVVAGVATLVNSISGGRLFGGKKEATGGGIAIFLGPDGANGNQFVNYSQRRSIFSGGGTRRTTTTSALDSETQSQVDQLAAASAAIVRAALGNLTATLPNAITGAYQQLVDKTGKVTSETITVLGVQYTEALEKLPVRVGAENIFRGLEQLTSSSLQSFAAQFRSTADGLLDAAVAAASAQTLIASGAGLLKTGDLLESINLVNELKGEGETLTAALTRVYADSQLLTRAAEIMGVALKQTEADAVRFAVDIVEAANGLDQAAALFDRFFAVAYTESERGLAQLTAAENRRASVLSQAGLANDTTLADLRTAIEALLKSGADPERLVLLLQAADAIADVSDIVAQLGDASIQSAASLAALKDAISELDKFTSDLDARFVELSRSGLTDFERQMLSINDQLLVDVAALQRTRAEMVKRGATTEQLARVDRELARAHSFAAQAAAQAIALLRRQGQSLVAQLRKNVADNVQGLADASSGAFQQISDAANDTYAAQLAGLKSIKDYLDSQLLGDLSSLTPEQRLAEAQAQFNAAVTGAQSGDPAALARLTQLADTLLREGRAFSPSSFPELEASIRAALSGLVNAGPIGNPTASNPGGFGGDGSASTAIDNSADQFGASQAELALQIAEVMRQLGEATGDTLAEVAASIGVNIGELVTALGISLTELTGASTQQLAALAGSLGVELSELASNVGVELGSLADRQSLLNDAVEAEIAALPESQRDQLQALFDAVQDAADDPAGLVIAEKNLSDAIKKIGGDTQNVLAPYFEDIDPTNPLLDINTTLNGGFADVVDAVNNINLIGEPVAPEGSFAVGSAFIPRDMIAQIHQGEAVIDAGTMQALRRYGIPVTGGVAANNDVSGNQELLAELRAMRTELAQLRATVAAGDQDNVKATARAAKVQADAIESTRAARTGRLVGSY